MRMYSMEWLILLDYRSLTTRASCSHSVTCRFTHDMDHIERAVHLVGDHYSPVGGLGLHLTRSATIGG